ncbi:MAG TPA: hypothetical protein VFZ53_11240 [Polyangiaceae bacterium]
MLVACSGAEGQDDLGAPESGIAATKAALETSRDKPSVSAIKLKTPAGQERLWVFFCTTDNRLRLGIDNGSGTFYSNTFYSLESDCADVPTAGLLRGAPERVIVFYRSTSNELNRLLFDDVTSRTYSKDVPLGPIAGAPVIASTRTSADTDEPTYSVVIRQPDNTLHTWDSHAGSGRTLNPVTNAAGTATIRSANTVQALYDPLRDDYYITGRGTANNDDQAWVAVRSREAPSGTSYRTNGNSGFYPTGTPGLYAGSCPGGFGTCIAGRFGSSMKLGNTASSDWDWYTLDPATACRGEGSPTFNASPPDHNQYGYFTGATDHDLYAIVVSGLWCTKLAVHEAMSMPSMVTYAHEATMFGRDAFFKCGIGNDLCYYQYDENTVTNFGFNLL